MSSVKTPPAKPARRKQSFPSSIPSDSVLSVRAAQTVPFFPSTSPSASPSVPIPTTPSPTAHPRPNSNPARVPSFTQQSPSSSPDPNSLPGNGAFLHKISAIAREKGSKLKDINISQKTAELNAVVAERLPEWKSKGAELGNMAKETGMVWGKKGWEAVDRWKKTRQGDSSPDSPPWQTSNPSSPSYLDGFLGSSADDQFHIFGAPLQLAVDLTRLSDDDYVPAIVHRCVEYLDANGVDEVGLYRIPGSTTTVAKLRNVFDSASDIDFRGSREDPHAVATLLKMYMRELPEPIIPDDLAPEFNSLVSSLAQSQPGWQSNSQQPLPSPDFTSSVAATACQLPPANFYLLKSLCGHLARIDAGCNVNKMNISNLGLIFCPTLGLSSILFRCFVTEHEAVFQNGPPVITDELGHGIADQNDVFAKPSPKSAPAMLTRVSGGIVGSKVAAISAQYGSDSLCRSRPSSPYHATNSSDSFFASDFVRPEEPGIASLSPAPPLPAPRRLSASARSSPTKSYFNLDQSPQVASSSSSSPRSPVSATPRSDTSNVGVIPSTSSSSTNTNGSSSSVSGFSTSSGSLASHSSNSSAPSPTSPSHALSTVSGGGVCSTANGLLAVDLFDRQTGVRNLGVLNMAPRDEHDRVRGIGMGLRPRTMSASEEPDRWRKEMLRDKEQRARERDEAVTTGTSGPPVRIVGRARSKSGVETTGMGTLTTGV